MILDILGFLNSINYKIRLLTIWLYVPEWDMAIQIHYNVVENAAGNNIWSGKYRILPLLIILDTNIIDRAWLIGDKGINQSLSTKQTPGTEWQHSKSNWKHIVGQVILSFKSDK
jgi:hypothetical protein